MKKKYNNFANSQTIIEEVMECYAQNLTQAQIIIIITKKYGISDFRAKDFIDKTKDAMKEHFAERIEVLREVVCSKLFDIANNAKANADKLKALDMIIRLTGIAQEVQKIETTERKFVIELAAEEIKQEDKKEENK